MATEASVPRTVEMLGRDTQRAPRNLWDRGFQKGAPWAGLMESLFLYLYSPTWSDEIFAPGISALRPAFFRSGVFLCSVVLFSSIQKFFSCLFIIPLILLCRQATARAALDQLFAHVPQLRLELLHVVTGLTGQGASAGPLLMAEGGGGGAYLTANITAKPPGMAHSASSQRWPASEGLWSDPDD